MRYSALILAMVLAGCNKAADQASPAASASAAASASVAAVVTASRGDLSACPKREPANAEGRQRKGAIPLPSSFAPYAASSEDNLAVSTLDGGTVCVDVSWTDSIEKPKVSADSRFLAFDWTGFEAFGHIVIDRSGAGQVLETGNATLAPPSGKRFAAIDLSESGFGGFNAFGVWQIDPAGLTQLAKYEAGLPSGDWKVEAWQGDGCVLLSLLPSARMPEDAADFASATRDPWHAAEAKDWKPEAGPCPGA
jgi:hypothetical protein